MTETPKQPIPALPEHAIPVFAEMGWPESKESNVRGALFAAGVNLNDLDAETIRSLLHMVDNLLGNKIPDDLEGIIAQFVATFIDVFKDKKLTLDEARKIINMVLKILKDYLPDDIKKRWDGIVMVIDGMFMILNPNPGPVMPI